MGLFHGPRAYPEYYERFYDRFDIYHGRAKWEKSIDGIPQAALDLWALHWLHLEVYNGGFLQFFENSTGVLAPEARDGFAAIGMKDVADIVQRAMDKLGNPYPFDREERNTVLMKMDERKMDFDQEDKEFYDLADTNKFFRRVPKFVPLADTYAIKHLSLEKE